jgi:hypothetical protein
MENPPARQPRVSPAAPRARRAWVTPACLAGAVVIAGAMILPPFAADTLFPSRGADRSPDAADATGPAATDNGTPSEIIAEIGDKSSAEVEAKDRDQPLVAAPADEAPQSAASETSPGTAETISTLASGVFASRPALETAAAAEPRTDLALRPIPPLGLATAAPAEATPAISPPPARREPLPLQTDLLPTETPAPKPGPDRHG